jgi:2-polyprenyl-3-methyl-5-hydroxy-6-metoxy-1,4-benzoquinol methylase
LRKSNQFFIIKMDVFGKVLKDHYLGRQKGKLWLHNSYGSPEDMPVDIFYRNKFEISELESIAIDLCKGKTLDIGAGVGSHALILQNKGIDVTAIEISEVACDIMQKRGVKKVVNKDIFQFEGEQFDTIIMMMNGIGLCGDMEGLERFLEHLKKLIQPGGQVIFDSSDIAYLYKADDFISKKYYGEISYQYEYQKVKGNWFKWLYVDFNTLEQIAQKFEWQIELIFEDEMDQFLVRMK